MASPVRRSARQDSRRLLMPSPTRRRFIGVTAALAAAGILPAGRLLADALAPAQAPSGAPPTSKLATVTLDCFGPDKTPRGPWGDQKGVIPDKAGKQNPPPPPGKDPRPKGTDPPPPAPGGDRHDNGLYRCICCDTAL